MGAVNSRAKSLAKSAINTGLTALRFVGLHPINRLKPLTEIAKRVPGVTFEQILQPEDYDIDEPDYTVNAEGSRYARYVRDVGTHFRTYGAGMAILPNGRFAFPTGMHGVGGMFPQESNLLLQFPPNHAIPQTFNLFRKPATTVDDGILLSIALSVNFYHWLVEIMPRLQLFVDDDRYRHLPIYVAEDLPKFVHDTLETTGIPADRFIKLPTGYYEAKKLYVPTTLQRIAWPSTTAIRWLRQTFLPKAPALAPPGERVRLLVSRKDAAERRLVNEDELAKALEPLGFQVVTLAGRKFVDQIALFRNAEIAIGSHGAGFVNMMFAEPDSALIEIVNNVHVGISGWIISKICGRKHGYIVGSEHPDGVIVDVDVAVGIVKQALVDIEAMRSTKSGTPEPIGE